MSLVRDHTSVKTFKKILLWFVGLGTAVTLGTTSIEPMGFHKGYETVGFATADGDLALDEYYVIDNKSKFLTLASARKPEWGNLKEVYAVRKVAKGEGAWVISKDPADIVGKTAVGISCEKCKYYSEYVSIDSSVKRDEITKSNYDQGSKIIKTELVNKIIAGARAAIAYDTVTNGTTGAGTASSLTFSHTTATGSNLAITVGTMVLNGRTISSVTYAGADMGASVAGATTVNSRQGNTFVLVAPATGAQDVVVTPDTTTYVRASSMTFSGVAQTSTVGNTVTENGVGDDPAAMSLNTGTANSVIVDAWVTGSGGGTFDSVTGTQTQTWNRHDFTAAQPSGDLNAGGYEITTTAGAYTHGWDVDAGHSGIESSKIMIELKPFVAVPAVDAGMKPIIQNLDE